RLAEKRIMAGEGAVHRGRVLLPELSAPSMSVKREVTVLVGVWMAGCIGSCSSAALLEEASPSVIGVPIFVAGLPWRQTTGERAVPRMAVRIQDVQPFGV